MSLPTIPYEAADHDLSVAELSNLWHLLCVELMDKKFGGRTHGNRRTYDAGCAGPLCRKAVREHGRRRNKTNPSDRYRCVDLILDAWEPVATHRLQVAQELLLQEIAPAAS